MTEIEKRQIIQTGIDILGEKFKSLEASIIMAAIAYQESNFQYRKQIGGPARGLWQFEKNGGVKGVMRHHTTEQKAINACNARRVVPTLDSVYAALALDDVLAAAFARLLLWTDPRPLTLKDQGAWEIYIRVWRPGKPHPDRWEKSFALAKKLYS